MKLRPKGTGRCAPLSPRNRAVLALEELEARDVPAPIPVVNNNDAGAGSLRQAIIDANNTLGADVIEFNIPAPVNAIVEPGTVTLAQGPERGQRFLSDLRFA
jgi:hypothetical protein